MFRHSSVAAVADHLDDIIGRCGISGGGLGEITVYAVIISIVVLVLLLYGLSCAVGKIVWLMRPDSLFLLVVSWTNASYL